MLEEKERYIFESYLNRQSYEGLESQPTTLDSTDTSIKSVRARRPCESHSLCENDFCAQKKSLTY